MFHDLTEENGYAVSRRNFLRFTMASSLGAAACWSLVPWRKAMAQDSGDKTYKHEPGKTNAQAQLGKTLPGGGKCKSVIMLFLNGGPSHIDTFDPKPGRDTGGPFKTVDAGHGILLSEHLPNIAKQGNRICVLRSVTSKEGSHERARFVMSTGYRPQGPVEFPGLGAIMAKEKARQNFDLPQNVAVGGGGGPGGGILGAKYAPFLIGDPTKPVDDMSFPAGVDAERFMRRAKLLGEVEQRFKEERDGGHLADTHREVYAKAERLLTSPLAKVFDLSEEKEDVKKAYGMGRFGQGVLMARRLVEAGVPFVEVTLGGWDTHQKNFEQVEKLSNELDPAMGTLIGDLADRGLLDSTMVVCGGEFGRTPRIRDGGRDHHPACFSVVMAGGGIGGGRIVGSSDPDGNQVKDRPIAVADIHATIAHCAGYDPNKQNESALGRPIRIVDPKGGVNGAESSPIQEALA